MPEHHELRKQQIESRRQPVPEPKVPFSQTLAEMRDQRILTQQQVTPSQENLITKVEKPQGLTNQLGDVFFRRSLAQMSKGRYCPQCRVDSHWYSECADVGVSEDRIVTLSGEQARLAADTEKETRQRQGLTSIALRFRGRKSKTDAATSRRTFCAFFYSRMRKSDE